MPVISLICSVLYDNLSLFHLWPVFQAPISEGHSAATHSHSGSTVSHDRVTSQTPTRVGANLYYGVLLFSFLSTYLGPLMMSASTPIANIGGIVMIVVAADSFFVGTIVFAFTQANSNSSRWPTPDLVKLAKLFAEQLACFLRVAFAFLTCFAFAQMESSTSVIPLPWTRTLALDSPLSGASLSTSLHLTVLATLSSLVLLHIIYVIRTVKILRNSQSFDDIEARGSNLDDIHQADPHRLYRSRIRRRPRWLRGVASEVSDRFLHDEDGQASSGSDDKASSVVSNADPNDTPSISDASSGIDVADDSYDPVASS